MSRRAYAALANIPTPHGAVVIRKAFAAKQRTYVAVLSGSHAALRSCLPDWHPRQPTSRQTQVSPPRPIATPAEAVAWIAPMVSQWTLAARGGPMEPVVTLVTVGDSTEAAERTLLATVRASTMGAYRKQWARIARHLPAETVLIACTRERVQAVTNALVADGLASTTVRAAVTALHRMLAPAIDVGLVPASAFLRLALPRTVTRKRPPITQRQRDDLLQIAAAQGSDAHLLFALGLLAGLRRAEILAMIWSDVDLDKRTLLVRSGRHFTTKSGKDRVVPLCRHCVEILASHRPEPVRPDAFIVAPHKPPRRGLRWAFAKTFTKVVTEAKLPGFSPHDMRRSFATLGVQAGISVWKLRTWMGHASVTTTEGYTDAARAFDPEVERISG
ncbi:MAG TPA: hypothetical protein DCS97_08095 [Planctomycetes bacterium]|nr:hypothetical protein [Planctomycetota bacterium]